MQLLYGRQILPTFIYSEWMVVVIKHHFDGVIYLMEK